MLCSSFRTLRTCGLTFYFEIIKLMVEKSDNRGSAAPESGTDTIESLGLDGIEI